MRLGLRMRLSFFLLKSDIEQLKLKIFSTMTLIASQVSVDHSHKSSRPDFCIHFLCAFVCTCVVMHVENN